MKYHSLTSILIFSPVAVPYTPNNNHNTLPLTKTAPYKPITRRTSFLSTLPFLPLLTAPHSANGIVPPCKAKLNCLRTKWSPPEGTGKEAAAATLREVLNTYPQKGQNGVDCNGWVITRDRLLSNDDRSYIALEFKSCVGVAAYSINFGQPFVDDVVLEMGEDGSLEVRSASRMGSSDLGVNKKRIDFLGDGLRRRGWNVPEVNYGG
mmetsp:Transcript_33620/g.41179  ORF Transcript_33620/g.41179 Transcript_33620/m.41179 type:complete len:207 (+) Transcript_33620:40-660(+)